MISLDGCRPSEIHLAGAHPVVNANDREEVFMPIEKSKSNAKLDKGKKPSKGSGEIRDDDLRSVSGGLSSTGGTSTVPDKCISQT